MIASEEAEETGPLDDPDDPHKPTIFRSFGDAAEQEQELLDSLKLDGFSRNTSRSDAQLG